MVEIAVIIPYYQVMEGLLRRAVESVLRACEPGRFRIVVIDDASPNRPLPEIADLLDNGKCDVTIISRENGGAAAARNTGLDHVIGHVGYVCFLDSDDEYEVSHLTRMMIAFSNGADFYFSDSRRVNEPRTMFEVCDFPRGPIEILSRDDGIYWFRGSLLQLTLMKNPFGTNTMGYRTAGQEAVRFRTEFQRACEDRFFALELSRKVRSVAFSVNPDVKLGIGVSIFASSAWGTPEGLRRMFDTTQFHVMLGREFSLSDAERHKNQQHLRSCDRDFWESVLVSTVKSRRVPVSLVKDYLALRPSAVMSAPHSLLRLIKMKLSRSQ
jgi:succinoglycan biosynthesis protein ExoW